MKTIPLGNGGNIIIDDCDFEDVSRFHWHKNRGNYPVRFEGNARLPGRKCIYLHRSLMPPPPRKWVDHVNGNKLDNRRENLRICKPRENCRNKKGVKNTSSQYKGVCKCKRTGRWAASIGVDFKTIWLGRHSTEEEAARAYDAAAKEHHGDFALLNFQTTKGKE